MCDLFTAIITHCKLSQLPLDLMAGVHSIQGLMGGGGADRRLPTHLHFDPLYTILLGLC